MEDETNSILPRLRSFSTRRASKGDEVDYWREARRTAYVSVNTDPQDSGFSGDIHLGEYTDFRLSTKRAQAEATRRSASDIAQGREDNDYLYLIFQLTGNLLVEQAGRTALASPGSLVIYDSATPFSLRTRENYEQVVLELPADEAFAQAGLERSDDLLATTFDCSGSMGAVASFFVNLAQNQEHDPYIARQLEPQAYELGASVIGLLSPDPVHPAAPDPVRRSQAMTYIRTHMADPDLNAERIAAGLHISRRTLFRAFEGTGASVMGHLRALRLKRAQLLLITQPGRSVSTIAYETGFSSPMQFHRSFRATAGMTPGEYRESQGTGATAPASPSDLNL